VVHKGLFGALEGLKQYSVGLEDGSDTERFTRKCNLFRTDLLLSLRCDQVRSIADTHMPKQPVPSLALA